LTGDPFVDAGITAIELTTGKSWPDIQEEDFKKAANELVSLYLTPAWSKELHSIFPNSTFINSSIKDKTKDSKEFLYDLISGLQHITQTNDPCIFCGNPSHKRNDGTSFTKSQIPLVGSSKSTNFFPSFQNGVSVCARCALAIQFAPLVSYKAGGKPSIVSSNNHKVIWELGREALHYIRQQKVLGAFQSKDISGIFDEQFHSPQNALFHLAYKLTRIYQINGICNGNEEITVYHYDNYNQTKQGIAIYTLPNNTFRFVAVVMSSSEYQSSWFELLSRHYKKAKDDSENLPVWKTSFNPIHDRLLNNQSILLAFKDDKRKILIVPFIVVERYLELVRGMNKQRIEKIKTLADRIAACIEETGNKQRVNDIISARDLISFRNQLRLTLKDWQKTKHDDPLITFDDYIGVLIPGDYAGWSEVRDLIVIRLYEKLHPLLVKDDKDSPTVNENLTGDTK